jgi:CRP-like cAMP-binding protein
MAVTFSIMTAGRETWDTSVIEQSLQGIKRAAGENRMGTSQDAPRHHEADARVEAIWAAMRTGPVALGRGDTLFGRAGTSGVVFRVSSGWVALTRAVRPGEGKVTVVDLALPGDLVGAEVLAAAGAEAAVCLDPVSVVTASEAVLRGLAAADPAMALWMARQELGRREWAEVRTAEGGRGLERRRLTALLSRILDRLKRHGGEPLDTFLLPLSLEQIAGLVATGPERFGDALEWLLDTRLLRCAHPTAEGVVVSVADRAGLRAIGRCAVAGHAGK